MKTDVTAPTARPGALTGLCLTMLMPSLATSIANAGLPALAQAFGASFQAAQWIILAFLLAITSLVVAVGRLGDIIGRRRLMLGGILVFTLASLICGLSPALSWLIAARALQGMGAAVMMALTMAFVGNIVPRDRTGSAMGLLGTMSAVGTALGPAIGGLLIALAGWRAIFLINLPLGIAALVLAWRGLPADGPSARVRFDGAGAALMTLALAGYTLAMSGKGLYWLFAALAAGGAFIAVERRASAPIVDLGLFSNRRLTGSVSASALVSTVMMAMLVVGPFYLTRALGLDLIAAGLALSAGPAVAMLAGLPAGRMVDRLGTRLTSTVGLAVMIAACTSLALIPVAAGLAGYLLPIALLTAGYALFQAANNAATMIEAGEATRGLVSAMLNLSRNIGLVTGASAMGALFAWGIAGDAATAGSQAIARGAHVTFAVAVALVALALAVVVRTALPARAAAPAPAAAGGTATAAR